MMGGSYTIRPACGEDTEALVAMWEDVARQHASYDDQCWDWAADAVEKWRSHFLDMLDKDDCVVLVAADAAGRAIGFVMARVRDMPPVFARKRGGMITDVAVLPDRRGEGIGTMLTEAVLKELKARGAQSAELRVAVKNPAALGLYEKLGMQTVMCHMFKPL
jgi:ribosomal protein S18 acetylase RimI-like enzyme